MTVSTDSAKRALFERLIDDASLFPPARLPMALAVADHRRHTESAYAWIGGRFVVPASRLAELGAAASGGAPIAVSVVLDGATSGAGGDPLGDDLERIAHAQALGHIELAGLELRPSNVDEADATRTVGRIAARFADRVVAFWHEVPYDAGWTAAPEAALAIVARVRGAAPPNVAVGAKVRCGGPNAASIPSPQELAAFLAAAHAQDVPWKASAGLHHPVRGSRDGVTMHGFLNVFVAGIALHAVALDPARTADVLAEQDPLAFVVDPVHLAWRDVRVEAEAIAAARSRCVAFGSCSFDEPVNDLREAGIIA
ncbi:MAG: hypothetical protein JOZ24_11550 [Candidatus Eremiobacteraeota bacterium]|nr:hypothetical protein [Candidatus Eremiobacteraeota bacterium]